LGFNSPSHNPENELPQWQQKIALRAENKACPVSDCLCPDGIFCAFAQFSAGIGPAHFPAETTRPLGPRLSAIFTFSFFINRSLSLLFVYFFAISAYIDAKHIS
jgi:hypothetical protein